jgi:hypothetical protein
MYTSIVCVALVVLVPEPATAESPTWATDYAQAQKAGQQAGKPLAVFVARGREGYDQVAQEGQLSPEARRLLAENYVSVFVNTDTPAGRRLAASFNLGESPGVVLSDRTGDYQAFHYTGKLTDGELVSCLKRFADPNVVVRNTVTSPYERVSYDSPQSETPAGRAAPVVNYYPPVYYPPVVYGGFGGGFRGGFGGGC